MSIKKFVVTILGLVIVAIAAGYAVKPSEVVVINNSGEQLQNVKVIVGPSSQSIQALALNEKYTFRPTVRDSTIVELSFDFSGGRARVPDCGCIGAFFEKRTISILGEGKRVSIDFGGVTSSLVDCDVAESQSHGR